MVTQRSVTQSFVHGWFPPPSFLENSKGNAISLAQHGIHTAKNKKTNVTTNRTSVSPLPIAIAIDIWNNEAHVLKWT